MRLISLHANQLPLAPLAELFEQMGDDSQRCDDADYMSSHPSDAERLARFRQADAGR